MTKRLAAILVGTHLLALAAGGWVAGARGTDSEAWSPPAGATKSSSRSERRVETSELLAAYRNPEFWAETLRLRTAKTRQETDSGTPAVYVPAEQRAAEIADIPGALQKELEAVTAGKTYDYELAKALIARWMKEDPTACAAWLGRMNSRVNWGDPFSAFARSLPPLELLGLMDGWLRVNRGRALSALAEAAGKSSAADLPAILERLGDDEARGFLESAARHARLEDAAAWLEVLGDDPRQLSSLAGKWIKGPGSQWEWRDGEWVPSGREIDGWEERADLALAAAAGTPAEEVFRKQWEMELHRSETGRELARVALEPAEASEALVALHMAAGHDEAAARRMAAEEISSNYRGGLEAWQSEAWERDLQLSLLGRESLADALAGRLDAIDSSLPEVLRSSTRVSSWRDAMTVDPVAAFDVARQRGAIDEMVRAASELVRNHETSLSVRAEILGLLADQGRWQQEAQLPEPAVFAAEYLRDDPEAARAWLKRLPPAFSDSLKEVTR